MKSIRKLMRKIRLREAVIKKTKGQIVRYAYVIKRKLSTPTAKKIAGATVIFGLLAGIFARKKFVAHRAALAAKNTRVAKTSHRSIFSWLLDGVALVSSLSALAGFLGGRSSSGRRLSRR
jgi:hypothetical protein